MSPRLSAQEVIDLLELAPLPGEGGYFRQTWVAEPHSGADGPLATAILYLVTWDSWSALHRLDDGELFHFYLGDPCRMVVCSPQGEVETFTLGTGIERGEVVQVFVPGGSWQGTRLADPDAGGYALLGTTMTPGFRPERFTLAAQSHVDVFPENVRAVLASYLTPQKGS